jgi:hypothetical protein
MGAFLMMANYVLVGTARLSKTLIFREVRGVEATRRSKSTLFYNRCEIQPI